MAQLDKDDLKQMNRSYFQSLSQERLVEVADNLHQLATELWEKQQQNSENSSQPPSAVTTKTAVFHIGSRRKEELSHLVTSAFVGWLITDGYSAYRSHPKRQRCLAHLIRKAIAITGAINQKAVRPC